MRTGFLAINESREVQQVFFVFIEDKTWLLQFDRFFISSLESILEIAERNIPFFMMIANHDEAAHSPCHCVRLAFTETEARTAT